MKTAGKRSRHTGSSFTRFLADEGILGKVDSTAQKRVLAWQISEAMRAGDVTKTRMAERMGTSRAAVDRLLDPDNASVTLATMSRAAAAVGATLRVAIELPKSRRVALAPSSKAARKSAGTGSGARSTKGRRRTAGGN